MQKRYRDILPDQSQTGRTLAGADDPAEPNDDALDRQQPKRRRVRVACNRCRLSRSVCDGRRPTCIRCSDRNVACEYITKSENETSLMALKNQLQQLHKDLNQHTDFLEHLQTVPETEALTVIRRLRSTRNVSRVLSSIKGSANNTMRISDIETARAILPETVTNIESELTLVHHTVYPALKFLDIDSIELHRLLFPGLRRSGYMSPFELDALDNSGIISRELSSSHTITADLPSPIRGVRQRQTSPIAGPAPDRQYCDDRLNHLSINYWTTVFFDNEFAACVLSYYLETYHPLFGCFDPDLFLSDLVNHKLNNCSPFLFSSLMSFACQSYSTFDVRSSTFSIAFFDEAERLWRAERDSQTPTTLAARSYLSMTATMTGKENLRASLTIECRTLGIKMNLFGVRATKEIISAFYELPAQTIRALAHIAWGTYAWLTFHTTHFDVEPIEFPPCLPIPGDSNRKNVGNFSVVWPTHVLPGYMGQTFSTLCRFWIILHKIHAVDGLKSLVPLAVAESIYQELLAWADSIPQGMLQGENCADHVFFFHAVFHYTVLTLFRPLVDSKDGLQLRSFASKDSTPSTIFSASLNQLKRLFFNYLTRSPRLSNCGWMNVAALQISHSVLKSTTDDPHWKFYFRLCLQFWKESYTCYSVLFLLVQGTLSLALELGAISSTEAKAMMDELRLSGRHHNAAQGVISSALLDFGGALSDPDQARADALAQRFEELVLFEELIEDI